MASREQLIIWLDEAEKAQHQLMLGQQEVSVRDSNGEQVTFSTANASRLADYIKWLKSELNAMALPAFKGPLRPYWS